MSVDANTRFVVASDIELHQKYSIALYLLFAEMTESITKSLEFQLDGRYGRTMLLDNALGTIHGRGPIYKSLEKGACTLTRTALTGLQLVEAPLKVVKIRTDFNWAIAHI